MPKRRLDKELRDFDEHLNRLNPDIEATITMINDETGECDGTLMGPVGSAYEGGLFQLNFTFKAAYPFKPPVVRFTTRVYHPNITQDGQLSIAILCDQWSPALRQSNIVNSLYELLLAPSPNDAMDPNIGHEYLHDRARFEERARQATVEYAGGAAAANPAAPDVVQLDGAAEKVDDSEENDSGKGGGGGSGGGGGGREGEEALCCTAAALVL